MSSHINSRLVVYFHGYGSNPYSEKVIGLQRYFKVIAPKIPIKYDQAKSVLENYVKKQYLINKDLIFVGTSLGGYWACMMADLLNVPSIIINPSCQPKTTLKKYNNEELINGELEKYMDLIPIENKERHVLLSVNDEVIQYNYANDLFKDKSNVYLFEGTDHRFNNIEIIKDHILKIG